MTATPCPSDFSLDDAELHGPVAALADHLAGCARCTSRRQQRAALAAEFRDADADAVWAAVRPRAAPTRITKGVGLAAAAALVLVAGVALRPATKERHSYVGVKGAVGMEVVCRRQARTFTLDGELHVQPGDELRFRPLGTRADARYAVLGSVDGTGRFAPFYPPDLEQPSVPLPAPGSALPGGVTIDDAPGPERLLLVVSSQPLSARAVAREAESGAASGRFPAQIDGVPVTSRWLVLPKQAQR